MINVKVLTTFQENQNLRLPASKTKVEFVDAIQISFLVFSLKKKKN